MLLSAPPPSPTPCPRLRGPWFPVEMGQPLLPLLVCRLLVSPLLPEINPFPTLGRSQEQPCVVVSQAGTQG